MCLKFKQFVTILALLVVNGCSLSPEHPLRMAIHQWPGYELFFLARSLGLYDKNSIRLIETASASETSSALRHGIIEAGTLTLDETLNLIQDGVDVHVVLVIDASNGADAVIAKKEISNIASLRGKRIGVETGAVGAIMLDAALQEGKLIANDVTIVPLSFDEHLATWQKGDVDALVTFEPIIAQALEKGGHVLFDSSQIPSRILDVLVVSDDALKNHPDALKQLISGYFAAHDYLAQKPEDALAVIAPRLDSTPESVKSQFNGMVLLNRDQNQKILQGKPARLETLAAELSELMISRDLLQHKPNITNLAEPGFLPQVNK
ncbi:MAG TPA: ABC transporter substrate-binding protein [Methylophilus sp.]|nr:ABC transporter substrate-binding protein [Methylophilus sp.]HQQ32442.1 ABC transporter substrate-binding protein [Methylophilus sp.]